MPFRVEPRQTPPESLTGSHADRSVCVERGARGEGVVLDMIRCYRTIQGCPWKRGRTVLRKGTRAEKEFAEKSKSEILLVRTGVYAFENILG